MNTLVPAVHQVRGIAPEGAFGHTLSPLEPVDRNRGCSRLLAYSAAEKTAARKSSSDQLAWK